MAGEAAGAKGLNVYDGSEPANELWVRDNERGDEIAAVMDDIAALDTAKLDASEAAAAGVATGSKLVRYKSNTRVTVSSPIETTDAANKAYVDAAVGSGNVADGQFASGPWDRNITWTRRAAWLGNDGAIELGHTASTRASKQNITPAGLARDALLGIPVVLYQYRVEVAKQRKDPEYRAAVEIGTLADDLHALGLWQFVVYEGRGEAAKPVSVHYELLGLAGIALGQILAAEVDELRGIVQGLAERVEAIEGA